MVIGVVDKEYLHLSHPSPWSSSKLPYGKFTKLSNEATREAEKRYLVNTR
jgi:hypothetical protein